MILEQLMGITPNRGEAKLRLLRRFQDWLLIVAKIYDVNPEDLWRPTPHAIGSRVIVARSMLYQLCKLDGLSLRSLSTALGKTPAAIESYIHSIRQRGYVDPVLLNKIYQLYRKDQSVETPGLYRLTIEPIVHLHNH